MKKQHAMHRSRYTTRNLTHSRRASFSKEAKSSKKIYQMYSTILGNENVEIENAINTLDRLVANNI